MPLSEAQLAARRKGGAARAQKFTREFQQAARAAASLEMLQAAGRKGNAACVRKYGPSVNARRFATWRKTAPTKLIKIVTSWIDAWWLNFNTEVEIVSGKVYADIVVQHAGHNIVIECDGEYWHQNNQTTGTDCEARNRERDAQIIDRGYRLLHLAEADILNGNARIALAEYLEIHP